MTECLAELPKECVINSLLYRNGMEIRDPENPEPELLAESNAKEEKTVRL